MPYTDSIQMFVLQDKDNHFQMQQYIFVVVCCKKTNRCVKELVGFINVFQALPQHVSASGCHLRAVVGTLEATQAMSVKWADTDYDPFSVVSCRSTTP
jgi:hypothetical protein